MNKKSAFFAAAKLGQNMVFLKEFNAINVGIVNVFSKVAIV
jgi:hypothetical protein